MKIVLAVFYIVTSLSLFNCNPSFISTNSINNSALDDSLIVNVENWKRATIHLEGATTSISSENYF